MKTILSYLFSKNKETYTEIARQNSCSVFRVCSIAHGKRAKTNKDYDIIQSLLEKGIVSGYRFI